MPDTCAQIMDWDPLLSDLRDALGVDEVKTGRGVPPSSRRDWSPETGGVPLAWVRPRSTEEVSAVLRICNRHGCPVVPQGGMTGLAGGAVPSDNAVLVSVERMAEIEEIDADGGLIVVQAGVTLQTVQETAAGAGMFFALDLGARGSCQIGGNIATNAGGNRVLRFGMTADLVLGLEVVLADGTVLSMMNRCPKNNAGPDLKALFVGSEGRLGIVTRAVLKLHPGIARSDVALVTLPDFDAALALLRDGQSRTANRIIAFEVMWPEFVDRLRPQLGRPLPLSEDAPLYALVEMQAGGPEDTETFTDYLGAAMDARLVTDALIAQTEGEAAEFWRLRDMIAELQRQIEPVVNFDVSIPISQIGRAAQRMRAALADQFPEKVAVFFGHVGDGNIHIVIGPVTPGGGDEAAIEACVYEIVRDYGGSISAEHGIGLHKKRWLTYSRTAEEIALMRTMKAALDPKGILNPGKVLDQVAGNRGG